MPLPKRFLDCSLSVCLLPKRAGLCMPPLGLHGRKAVGLSPVHWIFSRSVGSVICRLSATSFSPLINVNLQSANEDFRVDRPSYLHFFIVVSRCKNDIVYFFAMSDFDRFTESFNH
jgi:hypothetical protein